MPLKRNSPSTRGKKTKAAISKKPSARVADEHVDVFQRNGVWMVSTDGVEHVVRTPPLHEGFPGGEEVRQRLSQAGEHLKRLMSRKNNRAGLTAHDKLGIETERAHFSFAKIISESRALKDKGLHQQASDNLVHARKILDEINNQRKEFGFGPLTGKQLQSYQRPLTSVESYQLLHATILRQKKRKVRRKMLRILQAPEKNMINLIHARVEQVEKGNVTLLESERNEITRLLAQPLQRVLGVMTARMKQLTELEKKLVKNTQPKIVRKKTAEELLAELPARFAQKPKIVQRDMLTLLAIARKALILEQEMNRRGKKHAAQQGAVAYTRAMNVFGEILRKNE